MPNNGKEISYEKDHKECMTDEQMEDIIQKYLSNIKKKMMSLISETKRKKDLIFLRKKKKFRKARRI